MLVLSSLSIKMIGARYIEIVPEITRHPDYDKVARMVKQLITLEERKVYENFDYHYFKVAI